MRGEKGNNYIPQLTNERWVAAEGKKKEKNFLQKEGTAPI